MTYREGVVHGAQYIVDLRAAYRPEAYCLGGTEPLQYGSQGPWRLLAMLRDRPAASFPRTPSGARRAPQAYINRHGQPYRVI